LDQLAMPNRLAKVRALAGDEPATLTTTHRVECVSA
jgi:hypothetical protein